MDYSKLAKISFLNILRINLNSRGKVFWMLSNSSVFTLGIPEIFYNPHPTPILSLCNFCCKAFWFPCTIHRLMRCPWRPATHCLHPIINDPFNGSTHGVWRVSSTLVSASVTWTLIASWNFGHTIAKGSIVWYSIGSISIWLVR